MMTAFKKRASSPPHLEPHCILNSPPLGLVRRQFIFLPSDAFSSFKGQQSHLSFSFKSPFSWCRIRNYNKYREKSATWTSQKSSRLRHDNQYFFVHRAMNKKAVEKVFPFAFNLTYKSVFTSPQWENFSRRRKMCRCQLQSFTRIMTFWFRSSLKFIFGWRKTFSFSFSISSETIMMSYH